MAKKGRRPYKRHGTRGTARPDAIGTLKINRRGYGFVTTPEGDYFVPASKLEGAFSGDTVAVRPSHSSAGVRKSGRIVRVLDRKTSVLVGTYEINGSLGIVTPYDVHIPYEIFTSVAAYPRAKSGDVVSVRIISYPSRYESAMGVIEEIVGTEDTEGIGLEILIRNYGLETRFSDAAVAQAKAAVLDVDAALQEPDRKDLRDRFIFTIDPIDARDFDDAISIELLSDKKVRLGVHIADVSSYVPWGSSVDLDARRRATSVYLVDRVIPMLPEELSNGLCSLNPGEDRLAFTVDMVLDASCKVVDFDCYPSVIHSNLRLNYDQVQSFFDGAAPYPSSEAEGVLKQLASIANMRYKRRLQKGGIDFDSVETKLVLDGRGKVVDIRLRHRTQATGAIEEAMILANETVATFLEGVTARMVYRVHKEPSKDAILALLPLLQELDYPTDGLLELNPHAVQAVLTEAETRPEKDLICMKVLRSMKRAIYAPVNTGHFGLASTSYCHFTSPIRRYPDLLVHRILRAANAGFFDEKGEFSLKRAQKSPLFEVPALTDVRSFYAQLDWLCRHSSEMERVAQDASYDSTQMKLCEYMQDFVGQTFEGMVSSVSASGLYVTLPNTVKGLVHIKTLGREYFVYDENRQTLVGEETETVFHLGQMVQVKLLSVSVREMTIDFLLV